MLLSMMSLYSGRKKRILLTKLDANFKVFNAKIIMVTIVIGSFVSRADTDVCAALNLWQKKNIKIINRRINDTPSTRELMITYWKPLLLYKTFAVKYPYTPLKTEETQKLKSTRAFVRYFIP